MKKVKSLVSMVCCVCVLIALLSGCNNSNTMSVNENQKISILKENSELFKAITNGYTGGGGGGSPQSRDPVTWDDVLSAASKRYSRINYAEFTVIEKTDYSNEKLCNFQFYYKVRIDKVFIGDAKEGDIVYFMQEQYDNKKKDKKLTGYSGVQVFTIGQKFICKTTLQEKQKMTNGDEIEYNVALPESVGYPVTVDGIDYIYFFAVYAKRIDDKLTDTILEQFEKRSISLDEKDYQYIQKDYYNEDTKEFISTSYYPVMTYEKFEELLQVAKNEAASSLESSSMAG